jgi:hypothetical protein
MAEAGSSLLNGIVTVPTAGTRVQLPTLPTGVTSCKTVLVQALGTNEGNVTIGSKTVVAAVGTHATPTQSGATLTAGANIALQINDPTQIWVDVIKSGDGISYLVLVN